MQMKDCMATEIMMDKTRTVTLIQKRCEESIQIKKIHVLLPIVLITLISEYSPTCLRSSYIFCVWTVKTTLITECFPMQFG